MIALDGLGAETYSPVKREESNERHVRLEVGVSGVPVIQGGPELRTKGWPILPHKALIHYASYNDRPWRIRVTVYGSAADRQRLINGFAEYDSHGLEGWPDWLRSLVDQQHPDRPGGWPGDDPFGSYL